MATQAQIDAHERYNAKAYDEIKIRVPKGRKATLQNNADQSGISLNEYINRLFAFYCGVDVQEWKHSADYTPKTPDADYIRVPMIPGAQQKLSKFAFEHGQTLGDICRRAIVAEVLRMEADRADDVAAQRGQLPEGGQADGVI